MLSPETRPVQQVKGSNIAADSKPAYVPPKEPRPGMYDFLVTEKRTESSGTGPGFYVFVSERRELLPFSEGLNVNTPPKPTNSPLPPNGV